MGSIRPPAPLPSDGSSASFSAGRAALVLREFYADLGPHPVGSEANGLLRRRIREHLDGLGYSTSVQRDLVCREPWTTCAVVENLLTRLDGEPGRKAVMISTHYDSAPAGPGVSDAGVSVAVVMEMARILGQEERRPNPIILFIGDGEEAGLLGARAFLRHHPWADDVGAVINLEARGTGGRSWMFETSAGGGWLLDPYARSVPHPATSSVAYSIYKRLPTDTDLTVYREAGLHGLGLAFIESFQHYHTPLDSLENLSEGTLQQQGETALALARSLASMDLGQPSEGEAVFFDLLGRFTIWWPATWALPLALAALALGATGAWRVVRGHQAAWGGVARGAGFWLGAMVTAALLGLGFERLLTLLGAFPTAYPAHSWAPVAGAWAAGILATLTVSHLLAHGAGAHGLRAGSTLCWATLNVAVSLLDPSLSYPVALPALAAGIALHAGAGRIARKHATLMFLLPVAVAGLVFFPLILVLFGAMGQIVLPVLSLLVGLVMTLAAPDLAFMGRRRARVYPMAAAGALLVLIPVTILLPSFTPRAPQRMSLRYHLDPVDQEARWVFSGRRPIPAPLVAALGGEVAPSPIYPWWTREISSAPAPALDLQAPEASLVGEEAAAGPETVKLHLVSPRGARYMELILAGGSRAVRVTYPGDGEHELGEGRPSQEDEWAIWRFHTVPPQGIQVDVTRDGEGLEGYVLDRTAGLPEAGRFLVEARPATAVPSQEGDVTVVYRKLAIDGATSRLSLPAGPEATW
jgi:hypothetical protein